VAGPLGDWGIGPQSWLDLCHIRPRACDSAKGSGPGMLPRPARKGLTMSYQLGIDLGTTYTAAAV